MPLPALSAMSFISKYWKYAVLIGAVFVMYLYWADRTSQIEDLRAQTQELQAEIVLKDAQYEENERKYQAEIADQNAKIVEASNEYNELKRTTEVLIAEEVARNTQREESLEQQLNILKNLPTPQTCSTSIDLLVDVGVANPWPTQK